MVLGLEEGLVECATLCVKSWVILIHSAVLKEQYNQFLGKLYGTFNKDISGKLKAIIIQLLVGSKEYVLVISLIQISLGSQ